MARLNLRLTRISSNHNRLRTNEVVGWGEKIPEVGEPFTMTAPPLDPEAGFRYVTTSPVKSVAPIKNDDAVVGYLFNTENSTYQVDILLYEGKPL